MSVRACGFAATTTDMLKPRYFIGSDYLGEWHTHPEDWPKPSGKDLREWRILLREQRRPLVFLIVGFQGRWVGVGSGSTISPIECVEVD